MIKWHLVEVMKSRGIQAGVLASELGVSNATVSIYRSDRYPRLTGESLDRLLYALNGLRRHDSDPVTISDLIEWVE